VFIPVLSPGPCVRCWIPGHAVPVGGRGLGAEPGCGVASAFFWVAVAAFPAGFWQSEIRFAEINSMYFAAPGVVKASTQTGAGIARPRVPRGFGDSCTPPQTQPKGGPDVAPAVRLLRVELQMLPKVPRCCPRAPRYCPRIFSHQPGCPDVAPGCPDVAPRYSGITQDACVSPKVPRCGPRVPRC